MKIKIHRLMVWQGNENNRLPYLASESIAEVKKTIPPRYGITASGYTKKSGAPTCWIVRLSGEKAWRRVMCWQFSNAGTLFIRLAGNDVIVRDFEQSNLIGA